MKKVFVLIVGLGVIFAEHPCLSGGTCSTLCTQETTVVTARTSAQNRGVLSAQRRNHPANRSIAQLKIARQITAADIHTPGLDQKQKEERAKVIRLNAAKQLKKIENHDQKVAREFQARAAAERAEALAIERDIRNTDIRNTTHRKKARKSGSKGYPSRPHSRALSMVFPRVSEAITPPAPLSEPALAIEEA